MSARLLSAMLVVLLAGACGGDRDTRDEPKVTAAAQVRTQVERYLDLIDVHLAERLRAMPWVLDGSEESEEFVSALTNLEQSALYPGREQHQADISEILDIVQAAPWYSDDPPADMRLFVASLFELYADGYRSGEESIPDSIDLGEALLPYEWMTLIRDAIQEDLHVTHKDSSDRPVHLMSWGPDHEVAREVLEYAEQHLSEIEEITGAYRARYMLFVLDDEIDDRICGSVFTLLDVRLAVIRPDPECDLEVTVVHEMTHLIKTNGIARWFDEGIASYLALRVTGRDLDQRVDLTHELLGFPTFRPDVFHFAEGEFEEAGENARAAGFLFFYEFEGIAGTEALAKAVERVNQGQFGQDILDGFYFAAPEEVRNEVQDLVAKLCRYGERNPLTGERFGNGSNCTVPRRTPIP